MSRMQREKGKRFERDIADRLRKLWPMAIVRRASQAERADNPDVFVEEGPIVLRNLWLELQDARVPTPEAKLQQAESDANSWHLSRSATDIRRLPVVVWHKLAAKASHATMRLGTALRLLELRITHLCDVERSEIVTMDFDAFIRVVQRAAEREDVL